MYIKKGKRDGRIRKKMNNYSVEQKEAKSEGSKTQKLPLSSFLSFSKFHSSFALISHTKIDPKEEEGMRGYSELRLFQGCILLSLKS